MSWDEFAHRLSQTTVTSETQEKYRKMKKYQQDNVKDVGGFVAGQLKDGRRTKASVMNRCTLSLDMDHADDAVAIAENMEVLYGYEAEVLLFSEDPHKLDSWIKSVEKTAISELNSFVQGIHRDLQAVKNSIIYPYGNGLAEGIVN